MKGKDPEESKEDDFDYLTPTKIWPFFSQSCFTGYDSKKETNFYKVYGDLFTKLDDEEEQEEEEGTKHLNAPHFGDENSSAE